MRLPCPYCGDRDIREFSYRGAAVGADRPAPDASPEVWDAFVHLRDNPAGPTKELWFHDFGCSSWITVTRDTTTHEILGAVATASAKGQGS